jgi:hypothetical protein
MEKQSHSLEAYLVRKTWKMCLYIANFLIFFANMFATFCEIKKLKGIFKIFA